MRRILSLMLFLFIFIYTAQAIIIVKGDMVWKKMGGNPNVDYLSFRENVQDFPDPPEVKDFLSTEWEKGDAFRKFRIFYKGDTFGSSIYGGKLSKTNRLFRDGKITVGFDKAYAKYVECYRFDDKISTTLEGLNLSPGFIEVEYYAYYYFGNGYGGCIQCNNLGRDYTVEKYYISPIVREPCEPDTVWITEIDTIYVDRCRSLVSWSGWVSHAQDHFAESTPDSINYGDYYVTDLKDKHDDQLIWSLLGNITGKVHLGSWSLVGSFEAGYNDGPVDWQVRFLGIEKNWNDKFFLQFGPEYRYREWTKWEKVIINYIDPNNFEFQMQGHRAAIFDLGCYLQMEWFNLSGDNHARLYYAQGFRQPGSRVESSTSEAKFSFKLEPKDWYLFFGTKYQFMPTTMVDDINVPMLDHLSFEPRIGYSIHQNWILFARYRNIRNRTFENVHNPDWSLYERQDFGGGLFFRPQKMLGIKNFYAELIFSDSHIKEIFKNHYQDTQDELMEVKFTLFYHWTE